MSGSISIVFSLLKKDFMNEKKPTFTGCGLTNNPPPQDYGG